MQAAVLDTLRCAQTLQTAGFTPEQAEATAQVLGDALADVATKTDLDRNAAMQKADLDRNAAMQKADLDRYAAMQKADVDRLEAKLDGMEKRLDEKIDGKFNSLNGKINVLIGLVGIMLTAVFGFAFLAMAPNATWGEPQATVHNPADSSVTAQARAPTPKPLSEDQPATTPAFPPTQDTQDTPHAPPPDRLEGGM